MRLDLTSTDSVLEIGFGGGRLLRRMASIVTEGRIRGIDVSGAMHDYASRRCRRSIESGVMELVCGDAAALPYPDASFDKVCSVNSLFYWSDPARVFAEAARVLREGGRLVLVFTDRESLEKKGFASHGLKLLGVPDVREMLAGNGLVDLSCTAAVDKHRKFSCLTGRRAKNHLPS